MTGWRRVLVAATTMMLLAAAPATTRVATAAGKVHSYRIYLIAQNDNGRMGKQVGCHDSIVGVPITARPPTTAPLRTALRTLLAISARFYGESGLYNALYQSRLTVTRATVVRGRATVQLKGTMSLAGECDDPRVKAQLTETVMQFHTVRSASITINGKPLAEALSLKG
jgi:hypothetical protein